MNLFRLLVVLGLSWLTISTHAAEVPRDGLEPLCASYDVITKMFFGKNGYHPTPLFRASIQGHPDSVLEMFSGSKQDYLIVTSDPNIRQACVIVQGNLSP